jgi:ComF family protein
MRCAVCAESLAAADAERCGRCLIHPPAFRVLRAAAPYRASARSILLAFKFRGADFLGHHLGSVMVERIGVADFAPDEVTPVPATGRARRRRGYHAATVLAESIAVCLEVCYAPGRLRKVRETARQSGLALERRRSNVRGAFRVSGSPPPRILLVDDVATSGWTARECASALAGAGAKEVDVWCFARASRDDVDRDDELSVPDSRLSTRR